MYRPGVSTWEGRAPARPEGFRQIRGRDALVASAPRRRPSSRRSRQARPSRLVLLLILTGTMESGGTLQRCV